MCRWPQRRSDDQRFGPAAPLSTVASALRAMRVAPHSMFEPAWGLFLPKLALSPFFATGICPVQLMAMNAARLEIVASTLLPAPPYPADTQSKGWWFNVDMPRIRQSDTWALCPREIRPWLLLLWCTAWDQRPCGSLPADPLLIAARIDMPETLFITHQLAMLRGWVRHTDGKLYHAVITEQVLHVIAMRERDRLRKAGKRKTEKQDLAEYVRADSARSPTVSVVGSGSGSGLKTNTMALFAPPADAVGSLGVNRVDDLPCPYEQLVELYHEVLPKNPRVRIVLLSDKRKKKMAARWLACRQPVENYFGYATVAEGLAKWREFFEIVGESDFLTGKVAPAAGRRRFRAKLDWLMDPENFAKVLENNYHEDEELA